MKKTTLLLLLLVLPISAEPASTLSQTRNFEVTLCPEGSAILPGTDGDAARAMALAHELFRQAGPRLGSRFVEPCYLLALGDMRPYAGWNGFIRDYQPDDELTCDRLNRYLVPRGISLHPERVGARTDRVGAWSIYSLGGLERRTRECRLDWVPKFQRSQGWTGYYQWQNKFSAALQEHVALSQGHFSEGFMLGYPDSAIDAVDQLFRYPSFARVDACIPNADYYVCGMPVYHLRAQDYDRPDSQTRERDWGAFLTAAYASSEHQNLAAEPDFQAARRAQAMPPDLRYQEGVRLSAQPASLRPTSSSNTSAQKWLVDNPAVLSEALQSQSDLHALASKVQVDPRFPVDREVVREWVLRGAYYGEPVAVELARLYQQKYPKEYAALLVEQIDEAAQRLKGEPSKYGNPWDGHLQELLLTGEGRRAFEGLDQQHQDQILSALERWQKSTYLQELLRECQSGPESSPLRRAWKRRS